MKTNSSNKVQTNSKSLNFSTKSNISGQLERINRKIKELSLEEIARNSKFQRRMAKKISPENFLKSFFLMALSKGQNTFELWAEKIGLLIGKTVSKQAVWLKMTQEEVRFLEGVLSQAIKKAVKSKTKEETSALEKFSDVIVEDSICQKLNKKLKKSYPGSRNQNMSTSVMRIDAIYSLKRSLFMQFKLLDFRDVDYMHSMDVMDHAAKGALVIRDLGYFVMKTFKEMMDKGISFISRVHLHKKIYDPDTKEEINLLKIMKKRGFIDKWVTMGNVMRLPVRFIAVRLEPKIVNERRRKARLCRQQNYTKEYMRLLEFESFITNCTDEVISLKEVISLYRLRWRIEIIFKTWKSYLGIGDVMECRNRLRVDSYILSMLIYVVLFVMNFYNYLDRSSVVVSLMKLCKYVVSNYFEIMMSLGEPHREMFIMKDILYHCKYDKRKRKNFNDLLLALA